MKVPEIITREWFNEIEAMPQEEVDKLIFTEEEKVRITEFVNALPIEAGDEVVFIEDVFVDENGNQVEQE